MEGAFGEVEILVSSRNYFFKIVPLGNIFKFFILFTYMQEIYFELHQQIGGKTLVLGLFYSLAYLLSRRARKYVNGLQPKEKLALSIGLQAGLLSINLFLEPSLERILLYEAVWAGAIHGAYNPFKRWIE